MERAAPEQLVRRRGAELPVKLLDPDQDVAHVRDRVHAEVRARAVRRASIRLDLEADEALVSENEPELGRLGHDRRIRRVALRDPGGADARHLLVADRRDDDVAAKTRPARHPRRPA